MAIAKKTGTKAAKKPVAKAAKPSGAPAGGDAEVDELIVRAGTGKNAPAARHALRALPEARVVPRLLAALADERKGVRAFGYEAGTATPEGRKRVPLATLLQGLTDEAPEVRLATLVSLNRGFGPTNAPVYAAQGAAIRPALAAAVKDADPKVAAQAKVVWTRLGLA